ncbi:MAG: type II toxin-antitoxin system RelE/ParE family toxin [Candidatus Berkiellales bacterium]
MNKKQIVYRAYSGAKFTIEWYYNKNQKSDALEYYQSLDEDEREAVMTLFRTMADIGEIQNKTKFRNEGDKIYAFKTNQERFLSFFYYDKRIIVVNGFRKKSQKLPQNEKSKALKRQADYLERVSRGEYYNE